MKLQTYKQRHGHDIDGVRPVMIPDDTGEWVSRHDAERLSEQLEAAQRERDEAIKQKNESGDRFYKAVKYGARLEAELKRRDEQQPSAEIKWDGSELSVQNVAGSFLFGVTRVYAAAPAAVLPPDNVTYFAFSPDYGFDFFKNKQDAINTAQNEIDGYREDRDDGWDEDVRRVAWGVVVQQAQGFDAQGKHHNHSEHIYQTCEYRLEPPVPGDGDV